MTFLHRVRHFPTRRTDSPWMIEPLLLAAQIATIVPVFWFACQKASKCCSVSGLGKPERKRRHPIGSKSHGASPIYWRLAQDLHDSRGFPFENFDRESISKRHEVDWVGRLIPSFAIRASRVVGLMSNRSAAPPLPRIRQPVFSSTNRI